MAENKTRETKTSVAAFLNAIDDKLKRARAVDRQVRKTHVQTIQREVIC